MTAANGPFDTLVVTHRERASSKLRSPCRAASVPAGHGEDFLQAAAAMWLDECERTCGHLRHEVTIERIAHGSTP